MAGGSGISRRDGSCISSGRDPSPSMRNATSRPRATSRLRTALTALMLLAAASSQAQPAAQPAAKQVLVLQSVDRGNLILDYFTTNFRVELDPQVTQPVNFHQVTAGPAGSIGASERVAVEFIRSAYEGHRKPDLVVAIAGPATAFARRHRAQLFPDTPLLLGLVDRRVLGTEPLGPNDVAITAINDYPRMIEDILRLLPGTRQVYVVAGSGPIGKFWRGVLDDEFQRFRSRVEMVWLDGLSLRELLDRSARLPGNSAILFVTFGTDASGTSYADERVFRDLHDTANAPLFAGQSVYLGHGAVGGSMIPIEELTRTAAGAAARLLNGAPSKSIDLPSQLPGPPTYDWRELHRWGIAESRLPAGSIMRFRAPGLWESHKVTVITSTAALLLQSLLIVGLVYERRARRQAESDSKRSLALAADASRRQTMSALTTSIAHELGQPLSSMIHNAEALQAMIDADRAPTATMKEILTDIRSQSVQAAQIIERHRSMLRSHQLRKKPIDLHGVVREGLALVAHDLKTREIQSAVVLSSSPCIVSGDPVLLQQVLVNLMMNAIDAMTETPKARRRLTIATEVRTADAQVSVRDSGTGLPPDIDGTLFTPFVTTKPHGLGVGLTIVRTILDAHGGTIDGRNNPDGGATFTITLPCGDLRDSRSGSAGAA